ncbi:MAG: formamidopyrimidine-DNA glycosylase, partial [Cognaticolwellia sp.]
MTRNLRAWLGVGPLRLDLVDARLLRGVSPKDAQPVRRVWRRAKYCVIEREYDAWILHFRMTGKVVLERPGGKLRARLLTMGTPVHFLDARCLGELVVLPRGELEAHFQAKQLGPEPFPEAQSGDWWAERLHGLRGAIKPALMRQDRVAGLGNIAASEICFRAGVDPRTLVPEIQSWDRIAAQAWTFLHDVVEQESGPEIYYVNEAGSSNPFQVYGRAGEACHGCGTS